MVLPDYRYDPIAYEQEEFSRPDEMMLLAHASEVAAKLLESRPNANVLDLCCGTGLSMRSLVDNPNVNSLCGVDNCRQYLQHARKKFAEAHIKPALHLADAVDVSEATLARSDWDIIMLSSAYHHIEDDRKNAFLRNVASLMAHSGRIVMAENILPAYDPADRNSYSQAVREFYREVLIAAKSKNPNLSERSEKLIQRVAQYGFDGDYEYKVSRTLLLNDLELTGLEVVYEKRVWPDAEQLALNAGNFVFVLRVSAGNENHV